MPITYINSSDLIVAANSPRYADVKNAAGQYLYAQMLNEHDAEGQHLGRQAALVGETDTFSGNGVAGRVIALNNANLTPKFVLAWQDPIADNLVNNGDFETGDVTGWTGVGVSGTAGASTSGGAYHGTYYAYIWSYTTDPYQIYQTITLKPGMRYRLDYAYKAGTAGTGIFFQISCDGHNWGGNPTADWSTASDTFTAAWAVAILEIEMNSASGAAGSFLIDYIRLTEIGSVAPYLLSGDDARDSFISNGTNTDISALATGSFTVGNELLNANGVTNYYLVLGVDLDSVIIGDTGAGSDPTWIQHGAALYGDGAGGGAGSSVEKYMEDLFLTAHSDYGLHNSNPYSGSARIEVGTYTGNGNDASAIVLTNGDLQILHLMISGGGVVWSRSASMAGDNTKYETFAAFQPNYIEAIDTAGEFTVGSAANVNETEYFYMVIGIPAEVGYFFDGDTYFDGLTYFDGVL